MFLAKKIMILIVAITLIVVGTTIYAYTPITTNWPTAGKGIGKVESVAGNIWATVTVVVQILAVAAIVFAGVRYMFASSSGKADIKKEMMYLVLGAILVFCTTTIINFIVNATNEIIN